MCVKVFDQLYQGWENQPKECCARRAEEQIALQTLSAANRATHAPSGRFLLPSELTSTPIRVTCLVPAWA